MNGIREFMFGGSVQVSLFAGPEVVRIIVLFLETRYLFVSFCFFLMRICEEFSHIRSKTTFMCGQDSAIISLRYYNINSLKIHTLCACTLNQKLENDRNTSSIFILDNLFTFHLKH